MTSNTDGFAEATRFADCLYPGLLLTYQVFPDNRNRRLTDPHVCHGPLDKNWRDLQYFNSYGAGIYATINPTDGNGRTAENVTALTSLFLDLDDAPLGPVLSCSIKPHVVLESSPARYQCRWKITAIPVAPDNRREMIALFRGAQIGLANQFQGDTKVSDIARVARIPGFYNQKRETPFLVRIIHLDNRPAVDVHEVCDALKIDLSPKALRSQALRSKSQSKALNIHVNLDSDDPIYEGERNVSIFSICRSLAYQDVRGDDLLDHALAVNQIRCNPPLPEDEVRQTATSVDEYFSNHAYLSPKKLAQAILDSYLENGIDLVCSNEKFYHYNYSRMSYEAVDTRTLYSRMRSLSDLTSSKDLLRKTLHELSAIARQGIPRDTLEYEFCRKYLIESPASKVILSEVYQEYKKWCRQKGCLPSRQSVLRKEIETRFRLTLKRIKVGKVLYYGFIGIGLRNRY